MLNRARLTFIDVGGLNLLLSSSRRATACGSALRLLDCSRCTLRLLRVTRTIHVFDVIPTSHG